MWIRVDLYSKNNDFSHFWTIFGSIWAYNFVKSTPKHNMFAKIMQRAKFYIIYAFVAKELRIWADFCPENIDFSYCWSTLSQSSYYHGLRFAPINLKNNQDHREERTNPTRQNHENPLQPSNVIVIKHTTDWSTDKHMLMWF